MAPKFLGPLEGRFSMDLETLGRPSSLNVLSLEVSNAFSYFQKFPITNQRKRTLMQKLIMIDIQLVKRGIVNMK